MAALIIPNGATIAQSGGDETPTAAPTESPVPTDTPLPADTATPTETAAPADSPTTDGATATPEATPDGAPAVSLTTPVTAHPRLSSALSQLADAYTAGGAASAGALAQSLGLTLQNADANVQVVAQLADGQTLHDARQVVAALSGLIEADTDGLLQISLPISNMYALADSAVFAGVRLPVLAEPLAGTYSSEGVSRSGADNWHTLGITGRGVKVAVIDVGFAGYTSLINTDLPPSALLHTKSFLSNASMGTSTHGTQVAQTLYDMAPGTELWLVTVSTDLEFAEAMDWLITQDVDIINSSIGFLNYDDGDGNGAVGGPNPLVDSVIRVDSAGILFVMAAGNQAFGHHEQTYADSFDAAHSHNWLPIGGPDIYNEIIGWPSSGVCRQVTARLSWNDWDKSIDPPLKRDYTLRLMRFSSGVWTQIGASTNDQVNGYPWPIEEVSACVQTGGKVALVVEGVNTGGDYLEVYANWPLEYFTPGSSLVSPADADVAFTVGAFNWLNTASLSPDSSQGPVNAGGGALPGGGEDIKPDITGPACTTTNLYNGSSGAGFCGASAAAAHVSGAVALYLQSNPGRTPSQLRSFFEANFVTDGGPPGKDSEWGAGTLFLDILQVPNPNDCNPGACPADSAWSMFQGEVTRTGSSAAVMDPATTLLWTTKLAGDARSPVISPVNFPDFPWPRGLVFVKASRYVYALNPDSGTTVWSFDLGVAGAATGQGAPAVTDYKDNGSPGDPADDEMYLYVGSGDGYFYKLNAFDGRVDTNQACKSAKLGTNLSKASPVIGRDGTVYLVDDAAIDRLIAVDPVGCKQKWVVNLGAGVGTSSPAYWDRGDGNNANDRIFVGADKLYAVTVWGGIEWAVSLKTGAEAAAVPTTPLVINNSVYAVNSLGDLYWISDPTVPPSTANFVRRVADVPNGAHASGSLAAYFDSDPGINQFLLYWGNLATIYRYDVTTDVLDAANPIRTHPLALAGANLSDTTPVTTNPAVNEGLVFFGASNGKLYAVDAEDTTLVNSWTLGGSTAVGLAVATDANGDGWLFVPSNDDTLRLFGALPASCFNCKAEPASAWPLFQRGMAHTGASTALTVATPATPWMPLWTRAPGGDVFPPVLGNDAGGAGKGITYFVTGRYLRALDLATRNVLWSYDLGVAGTATGFGAPAVSAPDGTEPGFDNGVVYVGGKDGFLHAVDAVTGLRVWANDLGGDISKGSPVIGDDGTVYVVEDLVADRLIAVSHLGSVRWTASLGASVNTSSSAYFDGGAPTTTTGDCVFVGGNRLYGFKAADGTACAGWDPAGYVLGLATNTVPGAPLITGGFVYALNNAGDLYRVGTGGGGATLAGDAPVGAGAGSLAFDSGGCTGGCIYWTLGGKLQRWSVSGGAVTTITGSTGATTNSTPVVDAAGNVFFGTSDFKLWWVTRAGTTATLVYTAAGSMANAGAIVNNPTTGGGDGLLLWPSADDKLYAFGAVEGGCGGCNLASGGWPALQSNNAHVPDPTSLNIGGANARQARFYTAAAPLRPPVTDGARLYFVSNRYLYARSLTSDSNLWTYDLGLAVTAGVYGMPAIGTTDGANRIVYVGGADGNLHAVDAATGALIWKTDVGNNISKASIAVTGGSSGLIFVVEDNVAPAVDNLVAVDYKGSIVWKKPIGNSSGTSSPAINGSVVAVGGGAGLYAFNVADGSTVSGFPAAIGLTNGSVAFLTDYYVVTNLAQLYRVTPTGGTTLLADVAGTGGSAAPLVLSGPTRVFFGVGAVLYRHETATTSRTLVGDLSHSSPLAGSAGAFIYVASSDGKMYILPEALGSISYSSAAAGASMAGAGAFIDNDTLVWPAQNGKQLVFENSGAAGSEITVGGPWPLFQQNDTHTGASGSTVDANAVEQLTLPGGGDTRAPVIDAGGRAYFTAGRYLNVVNVGAGLIVKTYDLGATSFVAGFASPAVVTSGGTKVIVADNNGVVRAYDPDSASAGPIWSVDVGVNTSKASPLVGRNSLVYVLEDAAVDRLHAISLTTGGLLWTTSLGAGLGTSSPMYWDNGVGDDVIFVGSDKLYAVNATTGAIMGRSVALTGIVASAPMRISNTVYVMTTSAKLYGFTGADFIGNATVSISVFNTSLTGAVGSASLATNNTDIFFAVGNKLYKTNTTLGTLTPGAGLALGTLATNFTNSTPLVDSAGKVFIGGADGRLYRVDGASMADPGDTWNAVNFTGWPKRLGVGTTAASAAGALAMDGSGNLYAPSIDDSLRRFGAAAVACLGGAGQCHLYTEAPWPMFQHDTAHSGHNSTGAGHRTPLVRWSKTTAGLFVPPRTPVLGPATTLFPSGRLYYTSGRYVIARDAANGNQVWSYDLGVAGTPGGGASPALLVVDDNPGTDTDVVYLIVGAKDGFLYALDANTAQPNGALIWRVDLGLDISKSSPLIGPDGTIYIVEDAAVDRLHAVHWNGARRWVQTLGAGTGASSPVLFDTTTDRVIVGSANKLYAFYTSDPDDTGPLKEADPVSGWPVTMPAGLFNTSLAISTSVAPSGDSLWALNNVGALYRVNPTTGVVQDGNAVTVGIQPIVAGVGAVGDGVAPAVQNDPYTGDDIVVFTAGARFYRIRWDPDLPGIIGSPLFWSFAQALGTSSPVIDDNGWSYVLDSGGYLRAFYRYATPPFMVYSKKIATQGTLVGGVIVGDTGMLFIPSRNNTVYAVGSP
jgi:outer membrane protein assembly factor BamB